MRGKFLDRLQLRGILFRLRCWFLVLPTEHDKETLESGKFHGDDRQTIGTLELKQRPLLTGHGIPELRAALANAETAVRLDRSAGPVRHKIDIPILGVACGRSARDLLR